MIRKLLNRFLSRRNRSTSKTFYESTATCQISNLDRLFSRFLGEHQDGLFVEVGAYDGVFASNTFGLAQQNWKGLLIEPIPKFAAKCRQNYRDYPFIQVVETAVGPPNKLNVTLLLADTLTTANERSFEEYRQVKWAVNSLTGSKLTVPCMSLDEILIKYDVPIEFDVLVVDVEGFETEVFMGFDIAHWRPKMMIVELVDTHPDLSVMALKDALLGKHLCDQGYQIVFKDFINTVFVRSDIWTDAYKSSDGDV